MEKAGCRSGPQRAVMRSSLARDASLNPLNRFPKERGLRQGQKFQATAAGRLQCLQQGTWVVKAQNEWLGKS